MTELLTQDYWDKIFANEDPWNYGTSDYESWKFHETLALLPARQPGNAVELACAEGHLTALFAPRVRRLLAVDISSTALARARLRCAGLPNVEFQQLNIATDKLPPKTDLILCSEVLFYLTLDTLKEVAPRIAASLRAGGHLLLAHANLVSDDPQHTGFDWGHPFGAKTIGEVFAALDTLALVREVKTPLFTLHLFRRTTPAQRAKLASERIALPLPFDLDLAPDLERWVIWDGAETTRAQAAEREVADRIPILMYHSVADDGPPELATYRVTPAAFRAQLRYLRRNGYRSITLQEWADSLAQRKRLPGRPVIITFDDGYQDFRDNAWPILERCDFTAAMFVVTDKVGGRADWDTHSAEPIALMDWDAIRALAAKGVEFGSHTASHRDLQTLPPEQVFAEGDRARRSLAEQLGGEIAAVAYPWGSADEQVRAVLQRCGYRVGLSTRQGLSTLTDEPMNLPRVEVFGGADLADFARSLRPAVPDGDAVGWVERDVAADVVGFDAPAAAPPATALSVDIADFAPSSTTLTPIHPAYARTLAQRLDALVGAFVRLQTQLLAATGGKPSLQTRLAGLFAQPLTGTLRRSMRPRDALAPGIVLGFDTAGQVSVRIEPKADHAASPESCLNTVEIGFTGGSDWLALEIDLDWPDLAGIERFQLSLYGRPSRPLTCHAALRLPHRASGSAESTFATVSLTPRDRNAVTAGELSVPDMMQLDTSQTPVCVLYFDTGEDLTLTLDYLNLYFA